MLELKINIGWVIVWSTEGYQMFVVESRAEKRRFTGVFVQFLFIIRFSSVEGRFEAGDPLSTTVWRCLSPFGVSPMAYAQRCFIQCEERKHPSFDMPVNACYVPAVPTGDDNGLTPLLGAAPLLWWPKAFTYISNLGHGYINVAFSYDNKSSPCFRRRIGFLFPCFLFVLYYFLCLEHRKSGF